MNKTQFDEKLRILLNVDEYGYNDSRYEKEDVFKAWTKEDSIIQTKYKKEIEDVIWVRNVYSKHNNRFELTSNYDLEKHKEEIIYYFRFKNKEYKFV